MKRILILLALACASAMQLRAQFFHKAYKELSSAPQAQLINTEEIQGHDDLDSLCYLRAYTFRMPYSSKSDKNKIDKLIERIQSQFESASKNLNSYSSIAPLNNGCQIKSRRVAHFFKKTNKSLLLAARDVATCPCVVKIQVIPRIVPPRAWNGGSTKRDEKKK